VPKNNVTANLTRVLDAEGWPPADSNRARVETEEERRRRLTLGALADVDAGRIEPPPPRENR